MWGRRGGLDWCVVGGQQRQKKASCDVMMNLCTFQLVLSDLYTGTG